MLAVNSSKEFCAKQRHEAVSGSFAHSGAWTPCTLGRGVRALREMTDLKWTGERLRLRRQESAAEAGAKFGD